MLNKERLAVWIEKECGIIVPVDAMFDVMVKRIHEYKRQHLFALYMIYRYFELKKMTVIQRLGQVKRVFMVGGKAAPGYITAKRIIKLITSVADVVNNDEDIGDLMKVVFLPNYNVSNAQIIIPAADLTQQISTAGTEASGTSNMKFVMNGAIIVGTMDGANIEIVQEIGEENAFIFGARVHEVEALKENQLPTDNTLQKIFNAIKNGKFGNAKELSPIIEGLEHNDYYLVKHDFKSYVEIQAKIYETYKNHEKWLDMTIKGALQMGKFSSDRTIQEYAEDIWDLEPVHLPRPESVIQKVKSKPHLVPPAGDLDARRQEQEDSEAIVLQAIPINELEASLQKPEQTEKIPRYFYTL